MLEEKSKNNWNTTENRFVCFLDIMGFKDLVMRKTHKEIYDLLHQFSEHRESLEKVKTLPEGYELDSIKTVSFSDSIVIFTKNDDVKCLELLSLSVSWLFAKAIESGIALKGSIAYGETSINISKQIFFGQSIIDSYLLQEDVAFYGIVIHNTVEEFINNNEINPVASNLYKECKAPLKYGKISHLILDWSIAYSRYKNSKIKDNAIDILKTLRNKTSGSPRRYIDNTIYVLDEIHK